MGVKEHLIESDKVLESVRAFRKLRESELSGKEKKSILDEDDRGERNVNLQLTVKKMSACQRILMIPYQFPHCLLQEEDEVCFIVGCKEGDKGNKRADHERYANEWKRKLRQIGIEREIHILPIMQLETEFKSHEARRKLCKAFDHFICDHRLIFRMPKLLGQLFFRRRKMPIRVYMKDEKRLKEIIEEALEKTLIHISPEGPNVHIRVGNLNDHTDEQIVENIRSVFDSFIPEHLPGGDANLNSAHLASYVGQSVPLYVSLASANTVDLTEIDRKFIDKQTPKEMEDFIDTMPGVKVKVRSDGKVIAVKDEGEELDTDGLLDEDYLDVFRDQEFEDRDEAKKRYFKHLARKGALKKVGKRFGANMLKLPSHVAVPKPAQLPKKQKLPKQKQQAPPVPKIKDALQGFDDEGHDDSGDDIPQLIPIEGKKAKKSLPKPAVQLSAKKAQRKSTTGFAEDSNNQTPAKQLKKGNKTDFVVESQKKTKTPLTATKNKGAMKVTQAQGTPMGKSNSTLKKTAEDTPRPILKTPRESLAKEKRKSVTFDFETPVNEYVNTPKDMDPTPIYEATPDPSTPGKKRKSSAFDVTPMTNKKKAKNTK